LLLAACASGGSGEGADARRVDARITDANSDAYGDATYGDAAPVACNNSGQDVDGDSVDDGMENCLLNRHAPLFYMPFTVDQKLPANVDWFLTRSSLRFQHSLCFDDEILAVGAVDQDNLITQDHMTTGVACAHTSTTINSATGPEDSGNFFFLALGNSSVDQLGTTDGNQWVLYGHAYRTYLGGTMLQYWAFYPYNDNVGSLDHEGDWETMMVRLSAGNAVEGVYFCAHGDCGSLKAPSAVTWVDSTHPTVWIGDGSHATYVNAGDCNASLLEGGDISCYTVDNDRWWTWSGGKGNRLGRQGGGVRNVGEVTAPMNGQKFIQYYSRWGQVGSVPDTTGPITPSFQSFWTLDQTL
jgi:hypothetical protein